MGNSENSGVINFGIKQYMKEQFNKVRKNPKREYLTISEVFQIQCHEDYPFDFRHLGILAVCDKGMDGKFTMEDFQHFALWIQINLVSVQMYQFKSHLQGRTTEKLIQILQRKDKSMNPKSTKKQKQKQKQKAAGDTILVEWFLKLLIEDGPTKIIKNIPYVKVERIKIVYQIFNVKMMTEMDIQSFLSCYPILQYEQNQQDQQYIAIPVCEEFIKHFIRGVIKTLSDIGYENTFI